MRMPPSFHPYLAGNTSTNREKKALKKIIVPLVVVFLMASLLSCAGKKEADRKTDADVQGKVLATVNGVPITEYDVNLNLKRVVHGEVVTPEATQNVLQALVRNELVYQQSLELGLDNNPEYRQETFRGGSATP